MWPNDPRAWPPERDAELRRLIAMNLTMTQMGAVLGISRGAIAGRMSRLNLKVASVAHQGAATATRAVRREASRKRAALIAAPVPIVDLPSPLEGTVRFLDLVHRDCRWITDPMDVPITRRLCCGRERAAGSSYCAVHKRLAAEPIRRR